MFYIWNPYLIIDFFLDKLRIKNLENSKIFLYSWYPIKISKIFEVLFNWFKTEKEILWELYKLLWKKDSFILWKYFLEKDIVVEEFTFNKLKSQIEIWLKYNWTHSLLFHVWSLKPNYIEPYTDNPNDIRVSNYEKYIQKDWFPDIYKEINSVIFSYSTELLELPKVNIKDLLYSRRTVRNFNQDKIDFKTLYSILYFSLEKVSFVRSKLENIWKNFCLLKNSEFTSLEFYIVVFDIIWLEPWIYHFNLKTKKLDLFKRWYFRESVKDIQMWQNVVNNDKFSIYITADFHKLIWRYRYSHKLRSLLIQIWKISQDIINFSTSYDVWVFVSPAIKDSKIEKLLEITDLERESVLYFMCFWKYDKDKPESYYFDNLK